MKSLKKYDKKIKKLFREYFCETNFENPKVSVIVPCYNIEKYIERTIVSLIKQTLRELEIILIDDGSSDFTPLILEAFSQNDKRITVLKQDRTRFGGMRNRAIEIAKGAYISFVNGGDYLDLNYFEKMFNTVRRQNVAIAASNVLENNKSLTSFEEEKTVYGVNKIVEGLNYDFRVNGKLYHFREIKDLRFHEQTEFCDSPYLIRAINQESSLVYVPEAYYHINSKLKKSEKNLNKKDENDKISTTLDLIDFAQNNNIDIGEVLICEQTRFWTKVKHYTDRREHYIFDMKVLTKYVPYNREKVFVVYNTACFGDVLLCNSLCRNIKTIFPESKTVFVADSIYKDAVKYQPYVDEVVTFDKKGINKSILGFLKFVRNFKYKKAYASIITYKNERNYICAKLSKSRYTVMGHIKDSKKPVQEEHNALLEPFTNKKIKNYPIRYNVPSFVSNPMSDNNYVVLCTLSKKKQKDMPVADAVQIIDEINKEGQSVVLTGVGEDAIRYAQELREQGADFVDMINKTSIPELSALLKNAKKAISVDTGTMHLACAVDVPTVAVFYDKKGVINWAPKKDIYSAVTITR